MTHWIRFQHADRIGFGILENNEIAVHDGDMFDSPTATGEQLSLDQVTPLSPTAAGKMLALWNNFHALATKLDQEIPPEPLYFIKADSSYLATGGVIRKPAAYDGKVVFEGELGIVIGKECRGVSEAQAARHVFGYTCINDVTAIEIIGRDATFAQWTRAKSFDTLFSTVTGYDALDQRIAKTKAKKDGLLRVLLHPEIPLHNNPAELGARQRVRKRDISFGPRTSDGAAAWDTFMTLVATAKKLKVSFFAYVHDRVSGLNALPSLAETITQRSPTFHPIFTDLST